MPCGIPHTTWLVLFVVPNTVETRARREVLDLANFAKREGQRGKILKTEEGRCIAIETPDL